VFQLQPVYAHQEAAVLTFEKNNRAYFAKSIAQPFKLRTWS